jgi:surfeit locus 1 family protein
VNGSGRFDFAHEVAIGSRAREGNPGVHLATPLLLAGHDTAVLVLRGWVYSANASTIDFARSHEPEDVRLSGYLVAFDTATVRRIPSDSNRTVYDLNRALLERRVGKPLAPYFIMMTHGGATGDSAPARMTEPRLDEGPHLSYAVQWFLFATIFGAGGTVVVLRSRSRKNT